jgi:murein endopeptidase
VLLRRESKILLEIFGENKIYVNKKTEDSNYIKILHNAVLYKTRKVWVALHVSLIQHAVQHINKIYTNLGIRAFGCILNLGSDTMNLLKQRIANPC